MPAARAVSHLDINLPIPKCCVIDVLPDSVIGIGGHRFMQHPVVQLVNDPQHLGETQHHSSSAFAGAQRERLAFHSLNLGLDHCQVVVGCALFHKKPFALSQ